MRAVNRLEPDGVTHLIVASCTGFTAPVLDFQIMRSAGLPDSTQRTIVGFMGCFAAVNALKLADQIVRADPASRVLVVNLELCSIHLQEDFQNVPKMLSFMLFGDGASAALVTAAPFGIALGRFQATVIPRSHDLITWKSAIRVLKWIVRTGARPHPPLAARIRFGAGAARGAESLGGSCRGQIDPGCGSARPATAPGRPASLAAILRNYGNMSSATLMFVLERISATTMPTDLASGWRSAQASASKPLPFNAHEPVHAQRRPRKDGYRLRRL